MRLVQRIVTTLLFPFAAWIESESRSWIVTCPACDHSESVWDYGGIRWIAFGEKRTYARCRRCRSRAWLRIHRETGR